MSDSSTTENIAGLADQFQSVFDSGPAQGRLDDRKRITPPRYVDSSAGDADRTASLKQALDVLSRSDCLDNDRIEQFAEYFMSFYGRASGKSGFRHMYSDVSDTMYSYFTDKELAAGDVPDGIVYLENNIRAIVKRLRSMYPDSDELERVKKLQDHISLEKIRIQNQARQNVEYLTRMASLSNEVHAAQDKLDERVTRATAESESAMGEIEKSKRDSVAILGILAAVVLAFNGGITFSTSSINAVYGYHPFRIAMIVLVVGFVLFNLLAALFTFLLLSTRVKKGGETPSPSEVWGSGCKLAYVLTNAVLVLGIVATFLLVASVYAV